ncbi:MAG TPA: tyrosine-type recombinase/integrase, partial [Candidatus Hydrogenedentes bacterium]|nr:tyrosine-type recombinase/integrase [Candidatus Hydrogenedentota bacterium]
MRTHWGGTGRCSRKKLRAPSKQRLPQVLTHAQCVALLGAVRSPVYRSVFGVMYGCGLRIGEAVAVTVKDIDAQRGVIRKKGKKGTSMIGRNQWAEQAVCP